MREIDRDAVRGGELEHAASMVAMLVRDEDARTRDGSRPARARRRSVSVSARPQSSITTVPEASATRQLPELPLASEAKRKRLT